MKIIDIFKKYRHSVLILADIFIILASYVASILFLDINCISTIGMVNLVKELCVAVLVYEIYLNIFQMYRNMIRYEIGKDYIKYLASGCLSFI